MDDPNYPVRYDEQHRRYYRLCYDHGTRRWLFVDWLNWAPPGPNVSPVRPIAPAPGQRRDSILYATNAQAHAANAGPAYAHAPGYVQSERRREGHLVEGTYNPQYAAPDSHYEKLDPSYHVQKPDFFQEGKMFCILFTEPAGDNAVRAIRAMNRITEYNSAISRVRYNEYVHTQVRRFIIVKRRREHCYAVPIFTYSNQATLKKGVAPQEHAIAYSWGHQPQLVPGEAQLIKEPICIVTHDKSRPLAIESRIYFGIHHPIQYNVKVKDLGYVLPDHMAKFRGYWTMENESDTQQSSEVTATAAAEQAIEDEEEDVDNEEEVVEDEDENDENELEENDDPVATLARRLGYTNIHTSGV